MFFKRFHSKVADGQMFLIKLDCHRELYVFLDSHDIATIHIFNKWSEEMMACHPQLGGTLPST